MEKTGGKERSYYWGAVLGCFFGAYGDVVLFIYSKTVVLKLQFGLYCALL